MLQPDEVAAMVRLHELGWGAKRLSKEFGCARNTVRRYLRAGGTVPFAKPERKTAFDGLDDWLRERFFRHGGNADVIRQELASEHGIVIGLRSVELRVQRWRRELRAQKRATVRFETVAATLQQFRAAGFRTDARALAVSPEMSSLGVLQRYAAQKESRGIGRMTTTEAHQNALRGMLDTRYAGSNSGWPASR